MIHRDWPVNTRIGYRVNGVLEPGWITQAETDDVYQRIKLDSSPHAVVIRSDNRYMVTLLAVNPYDLDAFE